MPPKKEKKKKPMVVARSSKSTTSDSSFEVKPKKLKPLTKKETARMKKLEKDMKEALVKLKKEAETLLSEFKATEEAAEFKAREEQEQQNLRVELLTGTCGTFNTARSRLIHENNKIREAEIWQRYTTTDQRPYPEDSPNMHYHLYMWQNQKMTDNAELELKKCDSYVDTLNVLDELIEYPLYSSKETVGNWKELRTKWRNELITRIDKSCFYLIKNLSKNFKQQEVDQSHIYTFDFVSTHMKLEMCAWVENKKSVVSLKWRPKVHFTTMEAEFVMPSAYRKNPFILRLLHHDADFFSDTSMTFNQPESSPKEKDMLSEINRCFEAKKEAKMSIADREREKIRIARQRVTEAQEAAQQAELSFRIYQQQRRQGKRESGASLSSVDSVEPLAERKKKKTRRKTSVSQELNETPPTPREKRRGVVEMGELGNLGKSFMQTPSTMKALDNISMKSALRKRDQRGKRTEKSGVTEDGTKDVFWTPSMVDLTEKTPKIHIKRASELCFEEEDITVEASPYEEAKLTASFESLDLMFGVSTDEEDTLPSIRQLVKNTVIAERDSRPPTKSICYFIDGRRGRRTGKSIASMTKKGTEESDEVLQTVSEIFEAKEEARQEQYMTSMYFQSIPHRRHHLNMREYNIVGGTYFLDIVCHESQPHMLPNGTSVQIFYGDMNIKREKYQYDYVPPIIRKYEDTDDLPPDTGLQHLLHVKIPLPEGIVFFEPPRVALWDRDQKYWTGEHVYKLETNFQDRVATFSLGRVLPFGFCTKKYCLLPYTSWTLKPVADLSGISLQLETNSAEFEFHVSDFNVSLEKASYPDGGVIVQTIDLIGQKMPLHKLIARMKSIGVNVFPDEDAFLYCTSSAKDLVLEDHTNLSMAMWSDSLEFQYCEWNSDYKRRKIAFKVREFVPFIMDLRYRTVVATSLSATIYRLGAEEVVFDESKAETYGFCPDVNSLLEKAFVHVVSPTPMNALQVVGVYHLLSRTKVLSYCGSDRKETPSGSSDESKSIKRRPKRQVRQKSTKKGTVISSGDRRSSPLTSEFSFFLN